MKQIPKKQFDETLRLARDIWSNGNHDAIKERIVIAKEITKITGLDWMAVIDFVDSIVRVTGLLPGANDEMIYLLLRVLGWEVSDEVQESESL